MDHCFIRKSALVGHHEAWISRSASAEVPMAEPRPAAVEVDDAVEVQAVRQAPLGAELGDVGYLDRPAREGPELRATRFGPGPTSGRPVLHLRRGMRTARPLCAIKRAAPSPHPHGWLRSRGRAPLRLPSAP